MDTKERLSFRIDSFTPDTLPMSRLAEYLAQLAALYGSEERVHFEKLKKGSAIVQVAIEEPAFPKVYQRLQSVKTGDPDPEAQKAFKAIDKLLRQDNAVGTLSRPSTGKILDFPGRKLPVVETHTIHQATTIDGSVIKIGGRDETIPVLLQDQEGKTFKAEVRGKANAKELSKHYLEAPLRFHGQGKWIRYANGAWELDMLYIQSYEEIDSVPANVIIDELRGIRGNGWASMKDPLEEWKKMRGD